LQHPLRQSTLAINADLGVLLLGETGTGKEVFARHLHAHSRWRDGPFVAINCAALPESLIEAELFGYEPGAFTGAQRNGSRGRLREANGGVLFLDEIGDMPLQLQSRLLRVLQERVVQPLGSDKTWPVQFGLISATNQQADTLSREENFRQDLYYRIQDHLVQLPALRYRADLRTFICAELRRHENTPSLIFADQALDILCAYHWPGNYRQLRSVLKTLAAFLPAGSIIHPESLPAHLLKQLHMPSSTDMGAAATVHQGRTAAQEDLATNITQADAMVVHDAILPSERPLPEVSVKDLQALRIRQALAKNRGNVSKTARELGLHRSTVYRQMTRAGSQVQ
jgi:transcriptional regulator with PAS, ATPase and Fis domain